MVQRSNNRFHRRNDSTTARPRAAARLKKQPQPQAITLPRFPALPPTEVDTTLSRTEIGKLKKAFKSEDMDSVFIAAMNQRYDRTVPYVQILQQTFYDGAPKDRKTSRDRLSPEDRERCLIALLAARGRVRDLAIHVYIALMLNITPREIADIVFLAGVYSGVPAAADGLETVLLTLRTLKDLLHPAAEQGRPPSIPKADVRSVLGTLQSKLPL